eukprot:jgi/Ulvmu1/12515/UM090_0002.1
MESSRRNLLRTAGVAAALMTNGVLANTESSFAFCSVKSTSKTLAISQNGYTEA